MNVEVSNKIMLKTFSVNINEIALCRKCMLLPIKAKYVHYHEGRFVLVCCTEMTHQFESHHRQPTIRDFGDLSIPIDNPTD